MSEVFKVVEDRRDNPKPGSYTSSLMGRGMSAICDKVSEEASELAKASLAEDRSQVVFEAADLMFHILVLLAYQRIPLEEVMRELERRRKRG